MKLSFSASNKHRLNRTNHLTQSEFQPISHTYASDNTLLYTYIYLPWHYNLSVLLFSKRRRSPSLCIDRCMRLFYYFISQKIDKDHTSKYPKPPRSTYSPDNERKTCQQSLVPGKHEEPSSTRNRKHRIPPNTH
jgi:hypothetical protein